MAVADRPSEDGWSPLPDPTGVGPCPLEAEQRNGNPDHFAPTVGEHVRLGQFLSALERADEKTLRAMCGDLARLALMTYPAMIRGLAWQAAENLSGRFSEAQTREDLAARLIERIQSGKPEP